MPSLKSYILMFSSCRDVVYVLSLNLHKYNLFMPFIAALRSIAKIAIYIAHTCSKCIAKNQPNFSFPNIHLKLIYVIPSITAQKVKLLSSVGPTERSFLANIEDIVNSALPIDKLVSYITIPAAEDFLLKKVGFCEEIMKVK